MIIISETMPCAKKVYATNYCVSRGYYILLFTVLICNWYRWLFVCVCRRP